jgi:hypothetical protein
MCLYNNIILAKYIVMAFNEPNRGTVCNKTISDLWHGQSRTSVYMHGMSTSNVVITKFNQVVEGRILQTWFHDSISRLKYEDWNVLELQKGTLSVRRITTKPCAAIVDE